MIRARPLCILSAPPVYHKEHRGCGEGTENSLRSCILLCVLCGKALFCAFAFAQGPDAGGYRWKDSDTTGGPAFQWLDISATGTRVVLDDDDNQGPFDLGFAFPFHDSSFSSIRVCSNGWLSFVSNSHQFHHFPIPDPGDPNALLAPLWADLNPAAGGEVLYQADTTHARFIVSWLDVPFYGHNDSLSFQVILDTSGLIRYQYLTCPGAGLDSCTVGIENRRGTVGLEYLRDGLPQRNRLHDSLAIEFYRLCYDVGPTAIGRPFDRELAGSVVVPAVVVWNPGRLPVSFPVLMRIGSGYAEQVLVTGLASLKDTVLFFPAWIPGVESCPVEVRTGLAGDEFAGNDTLRSGTSAAHVGELRHDDGIQDTWFIRVGAPSMDWAAAVRFTPPYSQYRLTSARILVSDTMLFRSILVCPDSSGAPGIGSAYFQAESVAATQPRTWLQLSMDTLVSSSGDIWLVAFWPGRVTGPQVGDDRSRPIDRRAYFGTPRVGWLAYNTGDLLMRLGIDASAGVAEQEPAARKAIRVSPNPFSRFVRFSGPKGFGIEIFDIGGRRLACLQGQNGNATWTPGRLPHGVYLARVSDRLLGYPVVKLVYSE